MNNKLHINVSKPSKEQLNSLLEFYQTRQYEDAEILSVSITEEFPKHPFAWKVLGAVLKQTGRISESLVVCQKSTQLDPQDAEAHNNLGVLLQELERLDEAEKSYRKAIALKSDYTEAHYNAGVIFQKLERLDEAEKSYGKAIALKPDYAEAHSNLAYIMNELGRLDKAEANFRQAIALKPDYAEAHYNLGVILQKLERLDEAEANFRQAIALKPDYAEAQYNLGNIMNKMGRLEEAEVNLRQAIALKPDYAEAYSNLGYIMNELGRLEEAEVNLRQAIALKPDYAEAHYNLSNIINKLGRLKEAETSYIQAIALKPDYVEAHYNLGVILQELERLDEAETSYRKAITLKPDHAEAYSNLGYIMNELGRLDKAESNFRQAIALKPDYAEAYSNLGYIMNELGRLEEAEANYSKAIALKPDYAEAWNNLYFSLQAMKLQTSSIEDPIPLLDEQVISKYALILKFILKYRLNQGSSSSESCLNQVINILSSTDNTFVKNPKVPSSELTTEPTTPKKITALVHFGRSGTGLLHSLIDGHPEVSTLPSIYFSEFFGHLTWEKIIANGWEEMADHFATIYDVLFDASSNIKIPTNGNRYISNIGRKEGMTNVGTEKNEVLSVDKKAFVKELKQLMNYHNRLNAFTFFKLVHSAYDKTLNDHNKKNLIFYHIHNPDNYTQLNFLRLAPNTNWLMMVREPIQSCESFIRKNFNDNSHKSIAHKISQMLFEIDQVICQNDNSIGVRLEDLKEHPKKTIQALCDWLGIKEEDSLYHMTAQSKKWWGDPSSPDYSKEAMSPFGKISTKHKLGSIFSENDQYILSTLFYPFSVRFGYAEENLEKFKNDLQTIRPMLDQMFDFEKKIVQNKKMNTEKFMKSGSYLFLRSGMIERWNTLNTLHTYPNMLTLLKIN